VKANIRAHITVEGSPNKQVSKIPAHRNESEIGKEFLELHYPLSPLVPMRSRISKKNQFKGIASKDRNGCGRYKVKLIFRCHAFPLNGYPHCLFSKL
jgi:hypothetical protein